MKPDLSIRDIEALTENEVSAHGELLPIKEHNCYLIDLQGCFKYSVLVFKNGKQMYYANDYELHHHNKTHNELHNHYIASMNRKLFTEEELQEQIQSYDEYTRKCYYLRNYWIQQYEHETAWCIGEATKEQKRARKRWYYCSACFCYVPEQSVAQQCNELLRSIETAWSAIKNDEEIFTTMIRYELANHEAGYTPSYADTLDSLGLYFNGLPKKQQEIITRELNKQIR